MSTDISCSKFRVYKCSFNMFQFFLDCDFVKGTDEKFPFNHFLNES